MSDHLLRRYIGRVRSLAKDRRDRTTRDNMRDFAIATVVLLAAVWVSAVKSSSDSILHEVVAFIGTALVLLIIWGIAWVRSIIEASHELYQESQSRNRELWRRNADLSGHVERLGAEPAVHTMKGFEVLEYMIGRNQSKIEIDDELSVAALKGHITVEAMPLDDRRWLPVPREVFQNHTFYLVPKDPRQAQRIGFGMIDDAVSEAMKMGGDIRAVNWTRRSRKVKYQAPMFCRDQIEAMWPPFDDTAHSP